jgi:catechol 2,3-dioxygenase-like lactoylglutathione lyase family enzyme
MTLKLALGLSAAVTVVAENRLVSGVGNFIHDVGELDRSVHFYRDVLGMELQRPPGDWQSTEGVLKMYDAVGGKFRVANAQIPGSPMRVEMVEFQGSDRKPVRRPWGVAGTSVLILTAADLTPILERLKPANVPALVKVKKACDERGVVVADPDGFAVMIVERAGQATGSPPAKSNSTSNFTALRFGYLVSGDALAKGPLAALGLTEETRIHGCRPIEDALMNAGGTASIVTLPGGFEIWLAKGKTENGKPAVRPHDPGAAVLRLMVSDVDAAVQALQQAQVNVVSAGGAIQTLPPAGLRATILRAPDDLFIQVVK